MEVYCIAGAHFDELKTVPCNKISLLKEPPAYPKSANFYP